MTSPLAAPLAIGNKASIRNRFFKSAASEQLGDRARNPKPGLATLYRAWAKGGAGLVVTGNVMVDRTALGEPFNVVLDDESDLDAFRAWAKAGTEDDTHLWMQLNHPGKQSPKQMSPEPLAPSAVPLVPALQAAFNPPRAMSEAEIRDTIARFARAAALAKETGFTGVQIHGAHGYLVSQFLSPHHNRREDQWGGTLENRMRFVLEIYAAIRAATGPDFPIGIKLNSADFQKGGFSEEDSMQVVKALEEAGIDLIEISGGTYEAPAMMKGKREKAQTASTQKREAYFLQYAAELRKSVRTPLVVTGGFRSRAGMEEALNSGATDLVGLCRPLILKPDLPNAALADPAFNYTFQEPSTGIRALDKMTMINLTWYEGQLWRLAKGQQPSTKLPPKLVALSIIWKSMIGPRPKLRA
ncbi:NADH:flavin oxidoreductase/NADH oxidase family protein [Shimia sp. R11_0]|uniref:NADH:flavin oxidoreductase/NADH oxidase family protein n=1 Tax=Shimia sp. R11_0 TaxID=2821096 RepID=UPI001ADB2825|nr:NADH:flavin oxidoreductase/NADH oxidase family protein [Shimia sp. R11_0]MBO9479607.1 NADH:flavin oxidoreductase/NADH oxidase family protein [Shimia sp. R11_0]